MTSRHTDWITSARLPTSQIHASLFIDPAAARVMLRRNHGVSTLRRLLRRQTIITMTSFGGATTLAADAMKSTIAFLRGGRAA